MFDQYLDKNKVKSQQIFSDLCRSLESSFCVDKNHSREGESCTLAKSGLDKIDVQLNADNSMSIYITGSLPGVGYDDLLFDTAVKNTVTNNKFRIKKGEYHRAHYSIDFCELNASLLQDIAYILSCMDYRPRVNARNSYSF